MFSPENTSPDNNEVPPVMETADEKRERIDGLGEKYDVSHSEEAPDEEDEFDEAEFIADKKEYYMHFGTSQLVDAQNFFIAELVKVPTDPHISASEKDEVLKMHGIQLQIINELIESRKG